MSTNAPKLPRLHQLASLGEMEALRAAIEAGTPVDEPFGPDALTPLHYAVDGGRLEAAELLLVSGANHITASLPFGECALHIAAYRGYTEIAELLLSAGTPVSVLDWKRRTPLHQAAEGGDGTLTVAELLLQMGSYVNAVDNDLDTPLTLAALSSNLAVARALIGWGAATTPVNAFKQRAIDVAKLQLAGLPRIGRGKRRRIHPDYAANEKNIRDMLRLILRAERLGAGVNQQPRVD